MPFVMKPHTAPVQMSWGRQAHATGLHDAGTLAQWWLDWRAGHARVHVPANGPPPGLHALFGE
jgi:hypothetical protein